MLGMQRGLPLVSAAHGALALCSFLLCFRNEPGQPLLLPELTAGGVNTKLTLGFGEGCVCGCTLPRPAHTANTVLSGDCNGCRAADVISLL